MFLSRIFLSASFLARQNQKVTDRKVPTKARQRAGSEWVRKLVTKTGQLPFLG